MKFEKPIINISMFMTDNCITTSGEGAKPTLEQLLDTKLGATNVNAKQHVDWKSMLTL